MIYSAHHKNTRITRENRCKNSFHACMGTSWNKVKMWYMRCVYFVMRWKLRNAAGHLQERPNCKPWLRCLHKRVNTISLVLFLIRTLNRTFAAFKPVQFVQILYQFELTDCSLKPACRIDCRVCTQASSLRIAGSNWIKLVVQNHFEFHYSDSPDSYIVVFVYTNWSFWRCFIIQG